MYQDGQGYIWIATNNGLQRYDGCRFLTYHADIHNPEALQTDWISTVFEDSHHRLWIGSDIEAPYLFDRVTGKFFNYNTHCRDKDNLIPGVWGFLEDGSGDIWISSKNGLFKLNKTTNQFENYNTRLGIAGKVKSAGSFATDRQGNIWFNTTDGLKYYDLQEKKIVDKRNNPAKLEIFNIKPTIDDILFDANNNAWLRTSSPSLLYKFDLSANKLRVYDFNKKKRNSTASLPNGTVDIISKDTKGNIVVSLGGTGLAIYHPVKDTFSIIHIDNKDPYGLYSNPESFWGVRVLIDREDNVWAGADKGINIFNPSRQYFSYYDSRNSHSDLTVFPSCSASGFLQTRDGDVYVSYYNGDGGILRLDSNLQFKKHYLLSVNGHIKNLKNQLWDLFRDDDGIIWAPNQDGTILKLDTRTGRLKDTAAPDLSGNINTIKRDKNGDIWIGHWSKGLIRIDHKTHLSRCYTHLPDDLSSPVRNILSIYIDGDSIIWAGTNQQGLLQFDIGKKEFTEVYVSNGKNDQTISSNIIKNIIPYNRDTLLIATAAGINIFDKNKRTFSVISAKDGLPNNFVQTIALDKHNYLWAGCVGGFCKIDIATRTVTNYDFNDGILNALFEDCPIFCLRNGNFLVADTKGFVVFNPDSVREKMPPPGITITGFRVFDKYVKIDTLTDPRKSFDLSYTDNNISIEFSCLQFSTPGKIRYYYQMEGVDKDWVLAGKDQTARYNQLRSGHYLFKIRGTDRNGVAAEGITLLLIYIVPPFWNTWWFYSCIIILAAGAIFFAARSIHDRRKEKELLHLNYEKKIAVVEMNTLRAQMNPHFIFNSLNSINTFILKNDQENATDYLSKFSQLVRLILDNSRTEWVLLENELKALKLYVELETLRFDKAFTYTICIDPDVLSSQVVVPPLIIQPYVENAIWHGLLHRKRPGGKIAIDIWKENNELKVQITDNGVGRVEAAKLESKKNIRHKSHGMKITAERLAIVNEVYKMNAAITVTDFPDTATRVSGTKVLLSIQYKTHAGINH